MIHGVKKLEYNDEPGGTDWTEDTGIVQNESQVEITNPGDDVQDPQGQQYYGGEHTHATIHTVAAATINALQAKWAADERVDIRLTLADNSTITLPSVLPVCKPTTIQAALGGRVKYLIDVSAFSPTPTSPVGP